VNGERKALIVANDQYENEGLRHLLSPAADADALGRVLGDPQIGGFDVRVIRNEPAHVIGTHIEDLFSEGRPDDVLLLHFSCHGLKSESGDLFFAGRDTRPNRLGSTALSADFVQRCMRASRSRSIILLLDCCYGGAFGQGVAVRAAGDVKVLDSFPGGKLGGGRGRAVITASSSMEYAFEGDRLADEQARRPSVFTSALVEGLATGEADRDEDGWVSLNELYDYVFDRVREQNPNQTPSRDVEMQGELYLARSRRRRIRPQPVPSDLRAAMTDANMFSRLGAVTELRGRLVSDNLPVATGAYEALHEIAGADIQYVAEAAAAALREAEIKPAERELHFGTVIVDVDPGARVVRLLGPPLARACTFQTSESWIRVAETADGIAVSVETARAGSHRGSLTLKGPTGEVVIPVEVEVRAVPAPVTAKSAQPEPAPVAAVPSSPRPEAPPDSPVSEGAPVAAAEPVRAPEPVAEPVRAPEPAAGPGGEPEPLAPAPASRPVVRTPWWAVAALTVGAAILIRLNWPGSYESRFAWHDDESGWHVYRSPYDPYILASCLALAGALLTPVVGRGGKLALCVVAGSGVFLAIDGATYLLGGIAADQVGSWIGSLVIGAGMAATALTVAKPAFRPVGPVSRPGVALVVAGGLLLVGSPSVSYSGVSFLAVSRGAGILGPLVLVALAWLALAVRDGATQLLLGTALGTAMLLTVVDVVPAWINDLPAIFALELVGCVSLLAGLVVAARR
jgi:hypothetical protein